MDSIPGLERFPWRRVQQPTPVFLPGKFPGQRSLVDYSPWGHKESDTSEVTSMHACKEKELATPLRCSCLENPRDRGAWWVYGIAQSWTQLKSLSSSSVVKNPPCQCRRRKRHRFNPWARKIPWSWKWQPTPGFLPGRIPYRGTWRATVHRVA